MQSQRRQGYIPSHVRGFATIKLHSTCKKMSPMPSYTPNLVPSTSSADVQTDFWLKRTVVQHYLQNVGHSDNDTARHSRRLLERLRANCTQRSQRCLQTRLLIQMKSS